MIKYALSTVLPLLAMTLALAAEGPMKPIGPQEPIQRPCQVEIDNLVKNRTGNPGENVKFTFKVGPDCKPQGVVMWRQFKAPPKKQRSIHEIARCLKMEPDPDQPNNTLLDCGSDEQGETTILVVPESYATFEGRIFNLNIYTDGRSDFSKDQPRGSQIRYTPEKPKA